MAREEIPLREITSEEIWIEVQRLRNELLTHNHLSSGFQPLNGIITGDLQSGNFISGSSGWMLRQSGLAEFVELTLSGGTIKYGKTSFTDSTNAGYYIGSAGIYFGAAADASKLKYTIADGSFDFIGKMTPTIGSVLATSYLSGVVAQANLNLANMGWTQTCVFSINGATPATQVDWGAGTFTSTDGTVYNISAGNTGVMTAKTYIYFRPGVGTGESSTTYQVTTAATTAVGLGRVLIGVAQNAAVTATFILTETTQIVGDNILVNTIAASKIVTGQLIVGTNVGLGTAQDSAGVTTIIGNTVTTGYVNALSITVVGAVTAGSLTGLTITGGTIQTAAAGKRIVMASNLIEFYNATPTNVASMHGGALGATVFLQITSPAGAGFKPIEIVQNVAANDCIWIDLKAASHGLYIYNESTLEAIHLKGKVDIVSPLLYLEQDGSGIPLEILQTAGLNSIKITTTAAITNQLELNVQNSGIGLAVNLTQAGNVSAGIEINHDGTGRGMYIHNDLTTSTNHGLLIQTAGIGYVAEFEAVSNVNRIKASVGLVAVSGQGAHMNLNPIANAPVSPTSGDVYYDTDTHLYLWNGSAWKQLDNA